MHRLNRRALIGGGVVAGAALAALAMRSCSSPALAPVPILAGIKIIARDAWGAQPRNVLSWLEAGDYNASFNRAGWLVYDQPLDKVLQMIVVHHSALPASDGPREIQSLHQGRRGFADIGYHYLIDAGGDVYEGRPINVRGAHVASYNTGAVGVCLLGNFERIDPSLAQFASLSSLVIALRDTFGITQIAGHRDLPSQNTLCPGVNLWLRLPALAKQVCISYIIDNAAQRSCRP